MYSKVAAIKTLVVWWAAFYGVGNGTLYIKCSPDYPVLRRRPLCVFPWIGLCCADPWVHIMCLEKIRMLKVGLCLNVDSMERTNLALFLLPLPVLVYWERFARTPWSLTLIVGWVSGVLIKRSSWGHWYSAARGEILRPAEDRQMRRRLSRLRQLIKNETAGFEDY